MNATDTDRSRIHFSHSAGSYIARRYRSTNSRPYRLARPSQNGRHCGYPVQISGPPDRNVLKTFNPAGSFIITASARIGTIDSSTPTPNLAGRLSAIAQRFVTTTKIRNAAVTAATIPAVASPQSERFFPANLSRSTASPCARIGAVTTAYSAVNRFACNASALIAATTSACAHGNSRRLIASTATSTTGFSQNNHQNTCSAQFGSVSNSSRVGCHSPIVPDGLELLVCSMACCTRRMPKGFTRHAAHDNSERADDQPQARATLSAAANSIPCTTP